MTRSPQEILTDHLAAVASEDMAAILKDYREDAVVLTAQGALVGLPGVELIFTQALEMLPKPEFNVKSITSHEGALLLQWALTSPGGRVNDGVDTFVFEGDAIRLQTISFTVEPL